MTPFVNFELGQASGYGRGRCVNKCM